MKTDSTLPGSDFYPAPAYILVVFVIMLVVLGVLRAASYAALLANEKELKKDAEDGNSGAAFALTILDKCEAIAGKLSIAAKLVFTVAVGVYIGFSNVEDITALVLNIVIAVYLGGVAFIVPKKLAMKNPEKVIARLAYFSYIFAVIFTPLCFIITHTANIILRIFGVDPKSLDESVTEEDIRQMVEEGEETGAIPETERVMINNVFEFNDTSVNRVMTHRTDVVAIPYDASYEEILEVAAEEGYTRMPVYEDSLDNIKGILHVKSIFSYVKSGGDFNINDYMIKPYFVPQAKLANELFSDMQKNKLHIAVVVDEYGGTAGIVTMEDLIESILGNIQDEYDDEEEESEVIDENTFYVDGSAPLSSVCEMADIELVGEEDENFETDTVGGFVISLMDKMPEEGDRVEFENVVFNVTEVDGKKISKIRVVKNESSNTESK